MLSIKRPASTHATLHLASMSGVLEEEAEAQKSSGGSRGLKNNGTGKRVERGVWTMMVKEHRLGALEQVQSVGVQQNYLAASTSALFSFSLFVF